MNQVQFSQISLSTAADNRREVLLKYLIIQLAQLLPGFWKFGGAPLL
jgi:hypothetical protein